MLDLKTRKHVVDLFNKGVKLELIADEFGTSVEELEKSIIESRKTVTDENFERALKSSKNKSNRPTSVSKMNIIRNRYLKAMEADTSVKAALKPTNLPEQMKESDDVFKRAVGIISDYQNSPKEEKGKKYFEFIELLKTAKDLPFTIEQSQTYLKFLNMCESSDVYFSIKGKKKQTLQDTKRFLISKLCDAAEKRAEETMSTDELKKISIALTSNLERYSPAITSAQNKIDSKITKIVTEKAIYKLRYDVSDEIKKIITDIADGNLDVSEAQKIIQQEAEKKYRKLPESNFKGSLEQQREQVIMQIRAILTDRPKEFPIRLPQKAIEQLDLLTDNINHNQSVSTVVKNLYNSGRIEIAKQLVDTEIKRKNDYMFYRGLKREIIFHEVGEMVLDYINNPHSIEEDNTFIDLLEQRLRAEKISLSSISIGQNVNTGRKISLADIWYEVPKKFK